MDNKKLSDFMPKANSNGEMVYGEISTSSATTISELDIINQLKHVNDPELGINIYDLGLVYEINLDQNNNIKITMTLTTVNCPVADSFPMEVAKKTNELKGVGQVTVKLTFDPPWNKDMMSEDARLALGY
tara:strand:- start:157 stop:546 length:390 start_codon:yes stop_codon:yes gene_type:complete